MPAVELGPPAPGEVHRRALAEERLAAATFRLAFSQLPKHFCEQEPHPTKFQLHLVKVLRWWFSQLLSRVCRPFPFLMLCFLQKDLFSACGLSVLFPCTPCLHFTFTIYPGKD